LLAFTVSQLLPLARIAPPAQPFQRIDGDTLGRVIAGNTTGNNNTASGFQALAHNTSGRTNFALGNSAGSDLSTGDNNIDRQCGQRGRVQQDPHRHGGDAEVDLSCRH